jgi:hypothetical protein
MSQLGSREIIQLYKDAQEKREDDLKRKLRLLYALAARKLPKAMYADYPLALVENDT